MSVLHGGAGLECVFNNAKTIWCIQTMNHLNMLCFNTCAVECGATSERVVCRCAISPKVHHTHTHITRNFDNLKTSICGARKPLVDLLQFGIGFRRAGDVIKVLPNGKARTKRYIYIYILCWSIVPGTRHISATGIRNLSVWPARLRCGQRNLWFWVYILFYGQSRAYVFRRISVFIRSSPHCFSSPCDSATPLAVQLDFSLYTRTMHEAYWDIVVAPCVCPLLCGLPSKLCAKSQPTPLVYGYTYAGVHPEQSRNCCALQMIIF